MAKSKYAPALFEVINTRQDAKDTNKLSVPKWWKSRTALPPAASPDKPEEPKAPPAGGPTLQLTEESSPAASPEQEPALSLAPVVAATLAPVTPPPEAVPQSSRWQRLAASEAASDGHPQVLNIEGGRVALSLTIVNAAVVAGVVVVALFTSYMLGRHNGIASAQKTTVATAGVDEMNTLLGEKAKPEVLAHLPTPQPRSRATKDGAAARTAAVSAARTPAAEASGSKNAAPAAAPSKGVAARHIVLETFKSGDKASAEFAQQWLASNKNIQTHVETRGDRVILVSAETFDFSKPGEEQRTQQYLATIKSLGKTIGREMGKARLPNYVFSSPAIRSEK